MGDQSAIKARPRACAASPTPRSSDRACAVRASLGAAACSQWGTWLQAPGGSRSPQALSLGRSSRSAAEGPSRGPAPGGPDAQPQKVSKAPDGLPGPATQGRAAPASCELVVLACEHRAAKLGTAVATEVVGSVHLSAQLEYMPLGRRVVDSVVIRRPLVRWLLVQT